MKRSRILLVDDEAVFAANMSKLLSNRGYRVKTADSGKAAVGVLEKETFDVIVLDLKMPGMDGIATLREIQKMGRFTETLILTGHGSIDTALEAVKSGAYDYLTKPCGIDELVTKIEAAFKKKDDAEQKDRSEKIQKIIESPSSAFDLFPKSNKNS